MSRVAKRLTDNTIKNAKVEKGKEKVLSDGEGLQVRVRKRIQQKDLKTFLYRYRHPQTNKICKLHLGTYPILTLEKARETRNLYNKELAESRDPKALHKPDPQKNSYEKTLIDVATMWFELKTGDVKARHADDVWRSLENHVFHKLANVPIKQINAPDTIEVLKVLEKENKLVTLKRICYRLNEIMDYAFNYGFISTNPLSGIRKVFKKPKKSKHHRTISAKQLPEFLGRLANSDMYTTIRYLIEFQLHTLTRASEAANARWVHIDFENKVWIIPAQEMKNYREDNPNTHKPHMIPLTKQTIAILEKMKALSHSSPYIFVSPIKRAQPVNSQTANKAIKKLGYDGELVSHGLRSIGSSTLKRKGYNHFVVEKALSHLVGNKVSRAYDHDNDYFEIREVMMAWWSQYIEYASKGIVPPENFLQPFIKETN